MAATAGVTFSIGSRAIEGTFPMQSSLKLSNLSSNLRSQFLGNGRLHVPSVATKVEAVHSERALVVRSSSIIDRFVHLFAGNPAEEEQVLGIYEINERDKMSPQYLRLCPNPSAPGRNFLGDLVPYTNKIYGPSGTDYLGISAGLCAVIEHDDASGGDRFETTYTHYLGGYGQLSGMGPYYSYRDSEMVVTGGTGIFKGARGIVKIRNLNGPLEILYTYHITGIPKLPAELTATVVPLKTHRPMPAPQPSRVTV